MILIITHKEDYTADFITDKLNHSGIPYFRFNCEDYLKNNITLEFGKIERFAIENKTEYTSVWYRRTKLPEINAANESERIYLLNEMDVFLNNLFGVINAKWLGEPFSVWKAENKLLQLSLAKQIGLNVPKTLVTTNKDELRCFIKRNGKTIIKPIGRGRISYSDSTSKLIFTHIISEEVINKIDSLELTPAIYQEYIEKEYELRVTVVGKDVFAASVDSQSDEEASVDWRRKKIKFQKYLLPEDVEEKCLTLLAKLNISYGAFDFIRRKTACIIF